MFPWCQVHFRYNEGYKVLDAQRKDVNLLVGMGILGVLLEKVE